ncbi:MAG: hypothetical protein R3200_07090 [Xanthomonadales bacterium]|nr:hypothetical protein [Xanthomonadales bacterium]
MTARSQTSNLENVLARLPSEDLPDHLWSRILETHHATRRLRRRRLGVGGGLFAVIVISLALVFRGADVPATDRLAELQARGQLLEERAINYTIAGSGLSPAARIELGETRAAILNLDQALALAYAEDRPDAEITALWERRVELLGRLLATYAIHGDGAQAI